MKLKPAQAWAPSVLMDFDATDGFAAGDAAYIRVRVRGFVTDLDGVRAAVCEPIDRDGKPCRCQGARLTYYSPVGHLVAAPTVAKEIGR